MALLLSCCRVMSMRSFYLAALLLLAPCLSSCGLYAHSERLKLQTEALQTNFKGLSAPQYLAAQQKHLEDASVREDLALVRYLVASRDVSLLNIVKPPAASLATRPSEVRLMSGIAFELDLSAGKEFLDATEIKALETAPFRQATLERAIPFYKKQHSILEGQYKAAGGIGQTDCKSVRARSNILGEKKGAAQLYQQLRQTCLAWSEREAALPDCKVGVTAGDLVSVCDSIANLEKEQLDEKRAGQINSAIAALEARVAKPSPAATKEAADTLAAVKKIVADAKGLPTNDDYKKVFELFDTLLGIDLTVTLEDVIKEGENAKLDKLSNFMVALLPAIDAVAEFQKPDVPALDQPSAILIGVAKIRHDLNLVQLEIDERTQKLALLNQEAAALRAQLHFLARAQAALCPPPSSGDCRPTTNKDSRSEALAYYINSFNLGRIPYEVLHFRELQLHRATLVKQAQMTEADYRSLIQPAIDQIAAYGAGGVNPDVLGPFLASLPVTGSIIAK